MSARGVLVLSEAKAIRACPAIVNHEALGLEFLSKASHAGHDEVCALLVPGSTSKVFLGFDEQDGVALRISGGKRTESAIQLITKDPDGVVDRGS